MTFHAGGQDEIGPLNLANTNAADVLRWLGYSPDCCGELGARDLAARCRRRPWPEPRNFDPGIPPSEERGSLGACVLEPGRRTGHLREKTHRLLQLAAAAGDGSVSDETGSTRPKEGSRMKAGTRVAFRPTPASRALYSYSVPHEGTRGTVAPVSFGGTSRTFLPGPGGGLVYVRWDSGEFCGVSRRDVTRVK